MQYRAIAHVLGILLLVTSAAMTLPVILLSLVPRRG